MNLSYWESKTWFSDIDFCVVGSGIVGLSCALQLRKSYPKSKILVLERGILPKGASTKNAGFACFGSVSELLSDLKNHSEEEVFNLVKERYEGLKLLRETLGDASIDYKQNGGFELFLDEDAELFEKCKAYMPTANELLKPIFKTDTFQLKNDTFDFGNITSTLIFNAFEGQIDTGLMMENLIKKTCESNICILNGVEILDFVSNNLNVEIQLKDFNFKAKHLCIATNAFARQLLDVEVIPARNQVLITKPISDLHIKGTFHLKEGYYYFRNIDNRILLGGGRHIDKIGETTTSFGITEEIQNRLIKLLGSTILPNTNIEIEQVWSGILGVGTQKKPIIKSINHNVHCAVRLGGMGVAIGSNVGQKLAQIVG